ncbi:MAG: hypothetical protein ATN34_01615 [Epulopiscium sp. Nele67-Bin002]|nr:MAG: hypothetical protein ATN34_01615 [Epulopiscium sp. Nele67-Bin002]OON94875.1 MAG: hypothetical protein ATN33_03820 [Epulopiscium sp. Nele67-Bin001]
MDDKLKMEALGILVVLILCIAMVIGSNLIFENSYLPDKINRNVQYYKAEVIEIISENLQTDSGEFSLGKQELKIQFAEGPYIGQQYNISNYVSRLYNIIATEGKYLVIACYISNDAIAEMSVYNHYRFNFIMILVLLFFVLIIWVGKFKGLRSVISLIFTGITVVYLMLPLLLRGMAPIVAALIVVFLSTLVTLCLVGGFSKKTFNAVIGTLAGVIVATVVAYVFGKLANLSGATMEETEALLYVSETSGLKIKGLLFAGILITSLGAVMDVAMSIASAMHEFIAVNPDLSTKELAHSGMAVGTDMIGTMTNTLILALAGGTLNNFILIFAADMDTVQMLNMDMLCVEILQALAGSVGIVLTVPLTVWCGCMLYRRR